MQGPSLVSTSECLWLSQLALLLSQARVRGLSPLSGPSKAFAPGSHIHIATPLSPHTHTSTFSGYQTSETESFLHVSSCVRGWTLLSSLSPEHPLVTITLCCEVGEEESIHASFSWNPQNLALPCTQRKHSPCINAKEHTPEKMVLVGKALSPPP